MIEQMTCPGCGEQIVVDEYDHVCPECGDPIRNYNY